MNSYQCLRKKELPPWEKSITFKIELDGKLITPIKPNSIDTLYLFTDGSKITNHAGFAMVATDALNTIDKTFGRLPQCTSSNTAEAVALNAALKFAAYNKETFKNISIFSDSRATVASLNSSDYNISEIQHSNQKLAPDIAKTNSLSVV